MKPITTIKMNYFDFLNILKKAGVNENDGRISAMEKLEKIRVRDNILSFVRDNWITEKDLIVKAFNIFDKLAPKYQQQQQQLQPGQIVFPQEQAPPTEPTIDDIQVPDPSEIMNPMPDPCESPLCNTPDGAMKVFKDIIFPACKGCCGRIFKDFRHCPWCGVENIIEDTKNVFFVPIPIQGKNGIKISGNNVIINDPELGIVTEAEVNKIANSIEKHIPKR